MIPVAVLVSGRGSNLAALIEASAAPDYPARIVLVISDRPEAGGLALARAAGIAAVVVDRAAYGRDRVAFEAALAEVLEAAEVGIACLAGFMRVLSPEFVAPWRGRMLNVHPSLLPAFPGLHTHARALAAGVKLHGASVHLVTAELDGGPILAQGAVPVLSGDDEARLGARVLSVEHRLYPAVLAALARGEIGEEGGAAWATHRGPREDACLLHPVG